MPDRSWTLLDSRTMLDYGIIRIREDRYLFARTDREAPFVVCESADWVLVIALTDDGQIVLVRQFRHGVQEVVLEIPGGLINEGESPEQAAQRELREETGFVAGPVRLLGRLIPNPALNNAHCHVVLAEHCRPTGEIELDALEQIEVLLRPLDEIGQMICSGQLCHALVIAALSLMDCDDQAPNLRGGGAR